MLLKQSRTYAYDIIFLWFHVLFVTKLFVENKRFPIPDPWSLFSAIEFMKYIVKNKTLIAGIVGCICPIQRNKGMQKIKK